MSDPLDLLLELRLDSAVLWARRLTGLRLKVRRHRSSENGPTLSFDLFCDEKFVSAFTLARGRPLDAEHYGHLLLARYQNNLLTSERVFAVDVPVATLDAVDCIIEEIFDEDVAPNVWITPGAAEAPALAS